MIKFLLLCVLFAFGFWALDIGSFGISLTNGFWVWNNPVQLYHVGYYVMVVAFVLAMGWIALLKRKGVEA